MRPTSGSSAAISISIRSERGSSSGRPNGDGRAIPATPERRRRFRWVAYDVLLSTWRGVHGGSDPARALQRFVDAGLKDHPASPFREAIGGWVLGSERFRARLRELAGSIASDPPLPEVRQLAGRNPEAVFEAVCKHYKLDRSDLSRRGDPHIARAVAAWLCRQHCEVTLHDLSRRQGLSRADSVPNLTRRIDARPRTDPQLANELQRIMDRIGSKPKTKFDAKAP